ncbi:diaminopropionate ammonia-lyase [Ideonella livida]|uniref:Diaminopropionate ammonia-lyase n=1 Tax=Ideonella livida TaxID=2707176 RepID=A0A7C9PIR9_9BURK|nr:diaminopropionate ammonia-lyase [Ideonella livida]NDY92070.1 diaminopropionate ammonia-lyase [Ideonella livida]
MLFHNPHATRRPADSADTAVLGIATAQAARARLRGWPPLRPQPTPTWELPGLARALGLGGLSVKDESSRSPLGSFKALGAPNALLTLVLRRWPDAGWTAASLLAGTHAAELRGFVVISATDGNHGRALAAAAQSLGCRCVIVLHAQVSVEREAAIAALGAEIVRIAGDYDESVREAARLAQRHGWQVVSDTSYDGYEDVPRDVMQGYGVLADELLEGLPPDADCPWTHVMLQGGVGGLAAGVVSYFCERFGDRRPVFWVVEPEQADCLLQSARQGQPARATGTVDSVMAGLACGETSPLAWRFLQPAVDVFATVSDDQAVAAMRVLAEAPHGDVPVLAGESGVAGLAALMAWAGRAASASGLDAGARVLILNTEGATAPAVYESLTGRSPAQVLAAQQAWLAARRPDAQDLIQPLMDRLAANATVGATPAGGLCRLALTDADRDARDQLVRWMRELDLQVQVDGIGNIFGTRPGRRHLPPVMTGSHLDTVATGGRLDGQYGVMAGLEVVRWLNARGLQTERPLVVAAFTNEEGVRFQPDMMGSLVHAGGLPLAQALDTLGTDGTRLGDELRRIGYAGALPCGQIVPHAFIELHIEQGPVMEAEGVDIGAVADLQGISWQEFTFIGQSNHAGTTPMHLRRDAGQGAAALAVAVRALAQRHGAPLVATVGALQLQPNLINVIPARATLTVDLRHTDEATLQRAEAELADLVQQLAAQERLEVQTRRLARFEPVHFDLRLVRLIQDSARHRGWKVRTMTSGAGHDAQMMARQCPAAMIFVPSVAGLSHNPREHTAPEDLARGAAVLLDVLLALAEEV